MEVASDNARPGTLFGIALTAVTLAGALGAVINAVNGTLSPTYFRNVLHWNHVEDVWRAAVAQGLFEGLLCGVAFSFVFTLVVGVVSGARATLGFAFPHLLIAGGIAVACWILGGLLAIGLATLSPDFYRSTFTRVPSEFREMLKYAWVGGSLWGALLGGVVSTAISSVTVAANLRRANRQNTPAAT